MVYATRFRKGISAAIAGVIVLALVVLLLFPFVMNMYFNALRLGGAIQELARLESRKDLELLATTFIPVNNTLVIENRGVVTAGIRYVVLESLESGEIVLLDLYSASSSSVVKMYFFGGAKIERVGSGGFVLLPPGSRVSVVLPSDYKPKVLVTATGKVIELERLGGGSTGSAEVAESVKIMPIGFAGIMDVNSLVNDPGIDVTYDPSIPENEALDTLKNNFAYRSGGALVKIYEVSSDEPTIPVLIRVRLRYGSYANVFVGYDPEGLKEGKKRFKIFITGTDFDADSTGVALQLGNAKCIYYSWGPWGWWSCTNPSLYSLVANDDAERRGGFRIVIEGLEISSANDLSIAYGGSTHSGDRAIGMYYYCGFAKVCTLYIHGYAKRIVVYVADPSKHEGGIDPYFFFADLDGNGVSEMVFITEDFSFGNKSSLGDEAPSSGVNNFSALDTTLPFWLVFKDPKYAVDSSKFAAIQVLIRVYFHDNAGSDTDEVDDPKKFLFSIALVDPETGEIVSRYDAIYQMLDDIEDTYPPNTNYITMNVPLLVPNTGKTYYVAVGFQDPYYFDGTHDDVDFTLSIEWIGISYFYRGG